MAYYGPSRPDENPNFSQFQTPPYLSGIANKIRKDLNKMARMYNGRMVRLFQVDESDARCIECTDLLTGKVISSNCSVCSGTGYVTGYTQVPGDFFTYGDIAPVTTQETASGNVERSANQVSFSVIYGPLLEQDDLIALVDTKDVYKLERSNPNITAMKGEVITQTATCSLLTKGRAEYKVISW